MPALVGAFAQRDAGALATGLAIEQAQIDARRVFGEQAEIDSLAIPGRTQGIGLAGPHFHHRLHAQSFTVGFDRMIADIDLQQIGSDAGPWQGTAKSLYEGHCYA